MKYTKLLNFIFLYLFLFSVQVNAVDNKKKEINFDISSKIKKEAILIRDYFAYKKDTIGEFSFEFESRIYGKANNREYGAILALEISNLNNQVVANNALLYIESDWGRFEYGLNDSLIENMLYSGNKASSGSGGVNGSFINYINLPIELDNYLIVREGTFSEQFKNFSNNPSRTIYYSPKFKGLQVGVSYTKQQNQDRNNVFQKINTSYHKIFNLVANYEKQIKDINIGLSFAFENAKADDNFSLIQGDYKDISSAVFGGVINYRGFKLGGSYGNFNNILNYQDKSIESNYYSLTAGYEIGKVSASIGFFSSVHNEDNKFTNIAINGTYDTYKGIVTYVDINFITMQTNKYGHDSGVVLVVGNNFNF